MRRYLPHLIDLVLNGVIDPGKVFDLTLPLDKVGWLSGDGRAARHQSAYGPRLGRVDDPDGLSQVLGPRDARVVFSRD